ncbi:hypothetical protein C7419_1012348 [Cupriavidus plantarum]|uniref:Cu/Ag efflux protein CusF n=1 Tax=Cupriavidus plantarum TaxID=942865 RepID=A0A316F1A4_9BURK|nr:hypothetical protein C7419_1012348 [Cupriavidus plantarum]
MPVAFPRRFAVTRAVTRLSLLHHVWMVLPLVAAPAAMAQQATIVSDSPANNNPVGVGAPVRAIPDDAGQARLVMASPSASGPQTARLGDKTVSMAPGLRVFSTDMQLTPVNALVGQKLEVRYRLDVYGQLLTAWIMTEAEYKAWKAAH